MRDNIIRNVTITEKDGNKRRTTMRMEPVVWEVLETMAAARGLSLHEEVSRIAAKLAPGDNLASAVRVAVIKDLLRRLKASSEGSARRNQPGNPADGQSAK